MKKNLKHRDLNWLCPENLPVHCFSLLGYHFSILQKKIRAPFQRSEQGIQSGSQVVSQLIEDPMLDDTSSRCGSNNTSKTFRLCSFFLSISSQKDKGHTDWQRFRDYFCEIRSDHKQSERVVLLTAHHNFKLWCKKHSREGWGGPSLPKWQPPHTKHLW